MLAYIERSALIRLLPSPRERNSQYFQKKNKKKNKKKMERISSLRFHAGVRFNGGGRLVDFPTTQEGLAHRQDHCAGHIYCRLLAATSFV
jgi:hypothetical protein